MPYPMHDGARGSAFGAFQCGQVNADMCSNHDTGVSLGEGHGRCSTG